MLSFMPQRIAIFNVNWLGDVLFSTAVIRNIRINYPDAHIACIIPPRCLLVLEGNPHLNEIILFDEKGKQKSLGGKFAFVKELRKKRFDTVFLLHRSFTRCLLTWLAGIPERIGYARAKRSFLLTKKIPMPLPDSCHRIDFYLGVIENAGLRIKDRHAEFFFSDDDERAVDDFLKRVGVTNNDFVIGLNPGGNWLPKRWPKENFARLADALIQEAGAKVVFLGGQADVGLVKEITGMMKELPIVATGVFNLKQLAAFLKKTDVFVSADSGPLHIANAVGTKKIIGIFGPTSIAITGPYPMERVVVLQKNIGCAIPCYVVDCKDNRCMKAVTPEEVLDEAKKQLKRRKG